MAQSELKTKSISVFKNGKSFVIKEGNVNTTDNAYFIKDVPNALFGTYWFLGKQAEVVQVTSKQQMVSETIERSANNFADLLLANKGRKVTISTSDNLLSLVSENEARLKLQAEVANDSEDIVNTDINFVVGVPNFKFAENMATLTSFIGAVVRDSYYDYEAPVFSNAFSTQLMGRMEESVAYDDEAMEVNVNAESAEDYHFYKISNVSLEKDSRAHYLLLDTPIKIKHLYECNLTLQDRRDYYGYDYESSLSFEKKFCDVFHTVEIKNDTNTPFTTGPVMIVDDKTGRPLSQDMITYTGAGQKSSIQISQAPDVRVEEQDKIISTKEQGKERRGYSYNLGAVESEVVMVNSKKEAIEMSIYKTISGKIKSATIKYEDRQIPGSGNINPLDKLRFNLSVKPGETVKFTYTYEVYVQN